MHDKAIFFSDLFGEENVYFFLFDELKTDPESTAKKLLEFLGLDIHLSTSVDYVVNPTLIPRTGWLPYGVRKISAFLRAAKLARLVDFIKYTIGRNIVYGSSPSSPTVDEADMNNLLDHFSGEFDADINETAALIGKDLSHWKRA